MSGEQTIDVVREIREFLGAVSTAAGVRGYELSEQIQFGQGAGKCHDGVTTEGNSDCKHLMGIQFVSE